MLPVEPCIIARSNNYCSYCSSRQAAKAMQMHHDTRCTLLAYLRYFLNEKSKVATRFTTLKVAALSSACLCICRKYQVWSLELYVVEDVLAKEKFQLYSAVSSQLERKNTFPPIDQVPLPTLILKQNPLVHRSELRQNPRDHLFSRTGKRNL